MTLYGAAKAPAVGAFNDGTTVAALTDNSGGTASETIAAMTNIDAITSSTGGTVSNILAAATNIATVTDGSTGSADGDIKPVVPGGAGDATGGFSSGTTRDDAITIINDNFKELIDGYILQKALNTVIINSISSIGPELITQRAANIVLVNAVASLAEKVSDLITHMNDGR